MRLFRNLNFLKATIGKLRGLVSYKRQFVVDNYPNTEEGKSTRHFEGPNSLEKLDFKTTDTKNWRVL
jgi:hypothetical protein